MKRIVILHGPSGVCLTRCADKIKAALSVFISVEHEDLEEQIKNHSFQRMTEAVWQVPREVIRWSIWPKAARECVSRLLSSNADLGLLTCHLIYYRGQTHEFYEPGDLIQIYQDAWSEHLDTAAPPLLVVSLIDDVYDVFARLAAKNEVFDIQRVVWDADRHRKESRRKKGHKPPRPHTQYLLAFGQVISIMLRILDWRSRETSAGDSLATRAAGRSFVVAIKHPTQLVRDLILSECALSSTSFSTVYLSHPITRLRKDQKKTGDWPDFVSQFHDFVRVAAGTELDNQKLLLFMPTAIDELRIAERQEKKFPFPTLHRRWPLISEDRKVLLYELPQQYRNYDEFEKNNLLEFIFNPPMLSFDAHGKETWTRYAENVAAVASNLNNGAKREVSGLLRILRQQIFDQIPLRDHTLVRQCGRFLLYRPLFREGVVSGGVGAELKNWGGIASYSLERARTGEPVPWTWGPAVFVNDERDKPAFIADINIIATVAARLRPDFGSSFRLSVTTDDFEDWLRGAVGGDEILGGEPSPEERTSFEKSARKLYEEERRNVEYDERTGGHRGPRELRREILVEGLDRMDIAGLTHLLRTLVIPSLIGSESA